MYHTIEYLDNGTSEGATDWRVAGYLASRINYAKLRTATRFVRLQTTIKDIAEYLHTHPNKVRESLYRLQDQNRIQIVQEPTRGRIFLLLNIGIDNKGEKSGKKGFSKSKVLFAPSLTAQVIWDMTKDNLKKAKTKDEKKRIYKYLIRAMERMDIPERDQNIQTLQGKLEAL